MWVTVGGRGRAWEGSAGCSPARGCSWVDFTKMLQSKGLLTTWVRKGVYSCGKGVPITWLAPRRAAAGPSRPLQRYKSAHSQITLSLPAPRPYQPTSFMPRPSLLTEGCVRLGDWGRWEHILESTLMTKESRTWHGRVVSLDPCAGSTRDTGLKSSKAGGPWGNKGQTRLSQGRDTSSGRKEVSTAQ